MTPASDIPAPRPTLSGIDAPAAATPVLPPVAPTPAPVAPAPSSVDLPVASSPVVEPVAPRIRARAAASAVPPVAPVEHVSRRSRRAQTGEQPVVAVPPIAAESPAAPERPAAAFEAELPTREEPAPLLDTVLVAAEPFELLEPALETVAPIGSTPVAEPVATAPADTASTWAADSLAKLLAAEAAATIASAAPLVETGALQPAPAPRAAEP
ncbi:MAG TPA: hypothetical protein VIP82_10850, partial [Microbacterium sp.]